MRTKVSREVVVSLIAKARRAFGTGGAIQDLVADYADNGDDLDDKLVAALLDSYKGVGNGFLSEAYELMTGEQVEVEGDLTFLNPCPCCGRRTLDELYDSEEGTGYEICAFCGWEDDGTSDPSVESSVNRGSMADYRARLKKEANFFDRDRWPVGREIES